jgi:RNA polymerase sigma-70 factor, ECF subfamily
VTAPSDEDLIRQVLAGARARYSVLIQRHQPLLYRYAVGMVSNPRTAHGLVEETFVEAYGKLSEARRREGGVRAWLLSILRGRCLEVSRGPGQGRGDASGDPGETGGPSPPSTLQEAIQVLPDPGLREAFLLKHVEGLEYPEMEAALGVGGDELRRRVHRAREMLWTGVDPG